MAEDNGTFTSLAKELREGESVSRSRRLPLADLNTRTVPKTLSSMRNSMNQIAARCRETTERDYRVESGSFNTHDGTAVVLTCVLTCLEDEGEDDI